MTSIANSEGVKIKFGVLCSFVIIGANFFSVGKLEAAPTITSPMDGAVIAPGEMVHVVVSPDGSKNITVIGEHPVGGGAMKSEPPYEFDVPIPISIRAGKFTLTAVGDGAPQGNFGTPIMIDVEKGGKPTELVCSRPYDHDITGSLHEYQQIFAGRPDPGVNVQVTAVFSDRTTMDVTGSTRIQFRTEDPAVAQVDKHGRITFSAVGKTSLKINYQGASLSVPITLNP